jgi:hypothetical protein
MKYFDQTFWKMAAGFLLVIAIGLASIYVLEYWWLD